MTGVVLCGGKSTRMGDDKGLLQVPLPSESGNLNQANTWAKTATDKIGVLQLQVVLSVNAMQQDSYATIFPAGQLIKDDDNLHLKGPLCGVLSVHLQYPEEDLLVLACDMPLMEPAILRELIKNYEQNPREDAFVYTNEGEPEPLCGIYKANGLSKIIQLYKTQQLPRHSMKYMLEHIHTKLLPLANDQKKYFCNFNAHAELNGL